MRILVKVFLLVTAIMVSVGCTSTGPTYYYSSGLNNMQTGWTKARFLHYWSGGHETTVRPLLRASQRQQDGRVVEVFTLPMSEPSANRYVSGNVIVNYWFIFRDDRLVQWGRPEDWQQVSGRYEIAFNPGASVR